MSIALRALRTLAPAALLWLAASASGQSPGQPFTVLEVPFDDGWNRAVFEDVAALPDGSAWAVGYAQLPTPPFGPENVTLAMRWDGAAWTQTPTPYVAAWVGGANDFLHAVAALAPDDVWAAGERHGDAGGLSVGAWLHVLHWDGDAWSEVPVPPPPGGAGINFSGPRIHDIAALAEDDVWFAGLWGEPNALFTVTWRPLAMHWDGSQMTIFPTPALYSGTNAMHLRQLAALGPDDIWGICRTNTASGVTNEPAVLHWDGSDWSQVDTPSLGQSVVLDDVVAAADDDVWVLGHTYFPSTPFALHWDGNGWDVLGDAPSASSATATGPAELYLGTSVITLFDGTGATVLEDFAGVTAPSVLGMDALADGPVWAVGRRAGPPGEDLRPLAAVGTAPGLPAGDGPWTDLGGGTSGMAGVPTLVLGGPLTPGSTLTLELLDGAPLALALLFVAGSTSPTPFLGGTLHAFPYDELVILGTDDLGALHGSATFPGAASGTGLWFQVGVADPSVPLHGGALSHAVKGSVP